MAAISATGNMISPTAAFHRTPIAKHSLSLLSFLKVPVNSDGVQANAAKIVCHGSETEKKTSALENQGKKRKSGAKPLPSNKEAKGAGKKNAKKSGVSTDMPKRPPSAFLCFMSSIKEEFKKENAISKSGVMLSKSAGSKWKSMSDEEKLPYFKMAADVKTAYQIALESYRNKHSDSTQILEVVGDNMISLH